jgi:tetratricopeptide (TPR) repeat protein
MMIENTDPVFPVVDPGPDPFAALLRSIHAAAADPALPALDSWMSEHRSELERSPAYLASLVKKAFPGRPVIMIVDPFEQVLTLCADSDVREKFVQSLLSICPDARGPNRVILIVDQLYEGPALALAALKPLADNPASRFPLTPVTAAEAVRIIESGAAAVGLKFDEGIVEDLAKEVAGEPGGLPALQFTLGQLWNERERNRITWDAYRRVGRPREALQRAADEVFARLSAREQMMAKRLFLQLARPTVEGDFIRHRIRRDVLPQGDPSAMTHVLEQFVDAGLIRRTPGTGWDDDRFDLVQEQLIRSWPQLRNWLQEELRDSGKKLQLVATARLWQESGFKAGYLLAGDALEEAETYRDASPELNGLIAASRLASHQHARRVALIRNAVIVVMAILLVFAVWQLHRAVQEQANAIREAMAAQRSAEVALLAVRSTVDAVSMQLNAGAISTTAAKALLESADKVFAAVEQRPELAAARADLLAQFSDVYLLTGDRPQALAHAEKAQDLSETLLKGNSDNDDWRRLLYKSAFRIADLVEGSDPERASEELLRALDIARQLAAKNPGSAQRQQNIAFIENKVGDVFLARKDKPQALDHYQAALAIGNQLLAHEPNDPERQKTVGDARMRIADLLVSQKRWADALSEYRLALAIREDLARKNEQNDVYQSNLSTTYHHIGDFYLQQQRREEALDQYEKAFAIRDRLAAKDPGNADWQSALANEQVAIGDALTEQNAAGAVARYRSALAIREQLATRDPTSIDWARNLATVHEKLGQTLVKQDQPDIALSEYKAALDIRQRLAGKFPDSRSRQNELAALHERIGDARKALAERRKSQDDLRGAIEAYRNGLTVIEAFLLRRPDGELADIRARLQEKIDSVTKSIE